MQEITSYQTELNGVYQFHLKDDKHFVGYVISNNSFVMMVRTGINNKLVFGRSEIKKVVKLEFRDIETRKNGQYFIY